MTRIVDTSVLYALLDRDDRHHKRALADTADPEPMLVPSEILVETVDLVRIRFGAKAAIRALADLLALPNLAVADPVAFSGVRATFNEQGKKLSLADCFVVQTVRSLGAEPLSYDRDQLDACRS